MPIDKKLNLIFIHIPKCGGTSIEKMLGLSGGEECYYTKLGLDKKTPIKNISFDSEEDYEIARSRNMQHVTFKELSASLDSNFVNSSFVFSVVRNPYTRLVSEYYHCLNGGNRIAKTFKNTCTSFDQFVDTQLDLPIKDRINFYDGHLETQASYLLDSSNTLNGIQKIYRFEKMSDVFEDLYQYSFYKQPIHAKKGEYFKNYQQLYSSTDTLNKVKQFYAQDFELFNYDPNTIPE